MKRLAPSQVSFTLVSFLLLALTACAGAATPTTRPTVTPIPTYSFVQPTEAPQIATVAAATMVAATAAAGGNTSLDPERVERGQGRYEALACGTCHGTNGEGTAQGPPLAGTNLSEDDFIAFVRSGGTIGIEHQYSTNRLSDSGGRNLYQYILSLSAGG